MLTVASAGSRQCSFCPPGIARRRSAVLPEFALMSEMCSGSLTSMRCVLKHCFVAARATRLHLCSLPFSPLPSPYIPQDIAIHRPRSNHAHWISHTRVERRQMHSILWPSPSANLHVLPLDFHMPHRARSLAVALDETLDLHLSRSTPCLSAEHFKLDTLPQISLYG